MLGLNVSERSICVKIYCILKHGPLNSSPPLISLSHSEKLSRTFTMLKRKSKLVNNYFLMFPAPLPANTHTHTHTHTHEIYKTLSVRELFWETSLRPQANTGSPLYTKFQGPSLTGLLTQSLSLLFLDYTFGCLMGMEGDRYPKKEKREDNAQV